MCLIGCSFDGADEWSLERTNCMSSLLRRFFEASNIFEKMLLISGDCDFPWFDQFCERVDSAQIGNDEFL
jgi:hypothetical protein